MLQFKHQSIHEPIGTLHAWQDLALNLGKLTLAGLFVTGTAWWMATYA